MSLRLYNLTIQPPTAIVGAAIGQYSGQKIQEIVLIRGCYIELIRPDVSTGKLKTVVSLNTFSTLRSIASFRIAGSNKDYILLGSDSGKISVLEYVIDRNQFKAVHIETFGKTGVRRVVPGQYLAVDPKGRAVLIASVEKNKLVYVLNRDHNANITISSPLEAHRQRSLVYNVVGIDVGYDNPTFAAIEREYDDDSSRLEPKKLIYYELDLGLNHVVRKWAAEVSESAAFLLSVPGGFDGPSGVLVGTDGYIAYYHPSKPQKDIKIPLRENNLEIPYLVAGVMHKMKGSYFFLVQTQLGDLFKISINDETNDLIIQYFDTIPVCISLSILKSGFLFAASESGDHYFFQFNSLGEDSPENISEFSPRTDIQDLVNLQLVDTLQSLNPLIHSTVDRSDGTIIAAVGKNELSTLRKIKYGLATNEIVSTELPASPVSVMTVKLKASEEYDRYIVLSFSNQTLVLSVGETVQEVTDSGLISNVQTLALQQMGRDTLLQIHSKGILQIVNEEDDKQTTNEWKPPEGTYITHCTTNRYQVAVALSNNQIVYFELDDLGQLNEYEEHKQIPVANPVVCISLGDVPEGRVRSSVLAVGCADSTIRLYSVDLGSTLESLSLQALTAPPSDVLIMSMGPENRNLYLHIGLENGVFISTRIDPVTGQLSDSRTRFLGPNPIRLSHAKVNGQSVLLALTNKAWIGHVGNNSSIDLVPLSLPNPSLRHACSFNSEDCPECIVSVAGKTLSVFSAERLGEKFYQEITKLQFTPRRVEQTINNEIAVIETDNLSSETEISWKSVIEIPDKFKHSLETNESAFSFTECFQGFIIGSSVDQKMNPKKCSGGYLTYLKDNTVIHRTKIEEAPLAMTEYYYIDPTTGEEHVRLLACVGSYVRLYSNGIKQLLRKCEIDLKYLGISNITGVGYMDGRIVISDIRRSVVFLVHKPAINAIIPFADDTVSRPITCMTLLDYNTVAAGDRFGNIFTLRVPENASQIADEDDNAVFLKTEQPFLNGTAHKVSLINHFYTGDVITSIRLASLVPMSSTPEVLVYTGLQGMICALMPISTRNDYDFFSQLESLMRNHHKSLVGRDHLSYRSYYNPVKHVIDGDLCECFSGLTDEIKQTICNELGRTVSEIEAKILNMRISRVY